ncbi:uncharacterized protein MICPUCDRAFT_58326 [Micromonas pusilla CCMP1545]|jgi:hypothetical protein|uniref:Predicted protein n=1 Tax=Micromonas pusilla (strain CCMP1545) TaxID=564608 RepID=C1MS31_MICPC|nr:uncharacterized protein MICPUCDRAFT_58326 [Micromonas pusilla CCMP1545]EEH57070.1 predicted protein [Micromonas pusilla CCMP1545]|tara:strand:- start:913 stop:1563 length:651 start_codon:yes stop_codon:yes gene_type:complete|eukprot:XP_003058615.1 predicted protein [Micromonas pusilla CCMP1545]
MGIFSKGTRSKGVTLKHKQAGQSKNLQIAKKDRTAAYKYKEAFMKEAMARHLAAATAAVNGESVAPTSSAATTTPTLETKDVAAARARAMAAPKADTTKLGRANVGAKLRSKVDGKLISDPGTYLVGALRFEGRKRPTPKKKKKTGERGEDAGEGGAADDATKIGHLMRPLKGDEIDFATTVDTNVRLPAYARGKKTLAGKRKKNKKKNALAARGC